MPTSTPRARAARLLRWYPRSWRERYGPEFAELLAADIAERPRSATRTADVARAGLAARLAATGLAGPARLGTSLDDPARASLAAAWAALALCLALGAAMWSQLAIAWRRAPAPPLTPGMSNLVMTLASVALLAFLALAGLAALPAVHAVARQARSNRRLTVPALVLMAALTVLAVGGHHFLYQWPGTGGHGGRGTPLPFIPSGLLAFLWSVTYWFSSFWGHWSSLSALSTQDLAWMAASPAALATAVAAAVALVRRAELSDRLLAYEARLAAVACAVMSLFLLGAGGWVWAGHPGGLAPTGVADGHAGLIDVAATVLLALALAAAYSAQGTATRARRLEGR